MNLTGDEKRIRQLFREMSLEDQRRAPEFVGVLQARALRASHSHRGARSFRLAAALAMLCVGVLIAVIIGVRHQGVRAPGEPDEQIAVAPVTPRAIATAQPPAPAKARKISTGVQSTGFSRRRHRRTPGQLAVAMKSLFTWRSPTASLLKAPGEDMLKSLPRLGESLQTIESFSPERFN